MKAVLSKAWHNKQPHQKLIPEDALKQEEALEPVSSVDVEAVFNPFYFHFLMPTLLICPCCHQNAEDNKFQQRQFPTVSS